MIAADRGKTNTPLNYLKDLNPFLSNLILT